MKRLQVIGPGMTAGEVRRRVEEIDEIADLPERAHVAEDRLYCDVLEAIAAGADSPAALAHEALTVRQLDFDRHHSASVDEVPRDGGAGLDGLRRVPMKQTLFSRDFIAGFLSMGAIVAIWTLVTG